MEKQRVLNINSRNDVSPRLARLPISERISSDNVWLWSGLMGFGRSTRPPTVNSASTLNLVNLPNNIHPRHLWIYIRVNMGNFYLYYYGSFFFLITTVVSLRLDVIYTFLFIFCYICYGNWSSWGSVRRSSGFRVDADLTIGSVLAMSEAQPARARVP